MRKAETMISFRNQTCGDRGCATSHQFCTYCENCMHHDRSSGYTHEACAEHYKRQQEIAQGVQQQSEAGRRKEAA